jgi:hypothetical protein
LKRHKYQNDEWNPDSYRDNRRWIDKLASANKKSKNYLHKQNMTPEPLHTGLEYITAVMWYDILEKQARLKDFSDQDKGEMQILAQRIREYEEKNHTLKYKVH